MTGYRAKLDIEIEVVLLLLSFFIGSPLRFHKISHVIDIATHGYAQCAVSAPISLQVKLVTVRQGKHWKICRHKLVRAVKFNRAAHRRARPVDAQVVEANCLTGPHHYVGGACRPAGLFYPPGQKVIDLYRREIRFHAHPLIVHAVADTPNDFDGNGTDNGSTKVQTKPASGRFI